jgi:hypothetical protein
VSEWRFRKVVVAGLLQCAVALGGLLSAVGAGGAIYASLPPFESVVRHSAVMVGHLDCGRDDLRRCVPWVSDAGHSAQDIHWPR